MSDSMFDYVTGDTVFADMLMQSALDERNFLLLEGESDHRVVAQFVNSRDFLTIIAFGRRNVVGAARKAQNEKFGKCVALVDADLAAGTPSDDMDIDGLVLTHLNDLDSEIFYLPNVLQKVVSTQSTRLDLDCKGGEGGEVVRAAVQELVAPLTAARSFLVAQGRFPSTRDFPLHVVYDPASRSVLIEKLAVIIASRTDSSEITPEVVEDFLQSEQWHAVDLTPLHNGHHLVAGLHCILAAHARYTHSREALEGALRAAVEWREFQTLPLVRELEVEARKLGKRLWNEFELYAEVA
jgi:hypothetical protein